MNPTAKQVKSLREKCGLTQTQAANMIYKTLRIWQKYEKGQTPMDPALWELFQLKTIISQNQNGI